MKIEHTRRVLRRVPKSIHDITKTTYRFEGDIANIHAQLKTFLEHIYQSSIMRNSNRATAATENTTPCQRHCTLYIDYRIIYLIRRATSATGRNYAHLKTLTVIGLLKYFLDVFVPIVRSISYAILP